MPIEFACDHCGKRLRGKDESAGKKLKCPGCQTVIQVPKDKWHLKDEDGDVHGPLAHSELDQWLAEGRVTAQCQVLQDGSDQWKWATDVYPQLSQPAAPSPPDTPPVPAPPTPAPPLPSTVHDAHSAIAEPGSGMIPQQSQVPQQPLQASQPIQINIEQPSASKRRHPTKRAGWFTNAFGGAFGSVTGCLLALMVFAVVGFLLLCGGFYLLIKPLADDFNTGTEVGKTQALEVLARHGRNDIIKVSEDTVTFLDYVNGHTIVEGNALTEENEVLPFRATFIKTEWKEGETLVIRWDLMKLELEGEEVYRNPKME